MDRITLRIIDGPDVGRVSRDLKFPITIGREIGNSLQIHDEQISRFHLKIYYENDSMLLVDLGSTNGTRVNGNVVQFWTLQPGDLVSLGRSLVLVGSREVIAKRLETLRNRLAAGDRTFFPDPTQKKAPSVGPEASLHWERTFLESLRQESFSSNDAELLQGMFPPELPKGLEPNEIASITKFLSYFSSRFRALLNDIRSLDENEGLPWGSDARTNEKYKRKPFTRTSSEASSSAEKQGILLDWSQYQNLLDIIALWSVYLGDMARDSRWDRSADKKDETSIGEKF